jgi:tRNA nucleotidyltransferase/poly(A) polymerase
MENIMKQLINKIKETITGTKFENKSFIAGGFVRDMVMGVTSKDIDIVVELPNGGIELATFLAEKLNGTTVVVFERFGTAQTVIDGIELEFVMTRTEKYSEGSRKPEVCFGTIQEDCARRDLTINSLLYNITTGEIIDFYNGKSDIQNKIIKTTSEPDFIYKEDPLRIMRTIRFSTKYGFEIEKETYNSLVKLSSEIKNISKERINDEFMKILMLDNFEEGLKLMIQVGLLNYIGLPELEKTIDLKQPEKYHKKDVLGHTIDVVINTKKEPRHRLAALLHDIGKTNTQTIDENGIIHFYCHDEESTIITNRFMKELKFSNEDIEMVCCAVRNHMRINEEIGKNKLRKLRFEIGDDKYSFLIDLCEADRKSHNDQHCDLIYIEKAREVLNYEEPITVSNLIVNGSEIMEMFNLKPSKEVGELLDLVSVMMFNNPQITKEEVILELRRIYNKK